MNTIMNPVNEIIVPAPVEFIELVRGNDQRLVQMLDPVVREHSTVLDMGRVRRIDAAGIAALIATYGNARTAGNTFRVCNVTPHVAEILRLVGLDNILVTREEVRARHPNCCLEYPAA